MKKELLNKPNQLISLNAERKLGLTERKAYNNMLKYAQEEVKFNDHKGNIFKIPCSVLHKNANLKNDDTKYIYKKLENLMRTVVRIYDKEHEKDREWKLSFNLLSAFGKSEDKSNYEFELNTFIVNSLKKQEFFTTLDLLTINSFSSQYSIIFYELAIRYQKYKIPKMTIEKVRELTSTENKYKTIKDFRKRVLDVACKEISEKTDIILSYTTEKNGRKIAFINFQMKKKESGLILDLNSEIEQETKQIKNYSEEAIELFDMIRKDKQIDKQKEIIKAALKKYQYEVVESNINYTNQKSNTNYSIYLKKALKLDYASDTREEKQNEKVEIEREYQENIEIRNKELEKAEEEDTKNKLLDMEYDNLNKENKSAVIQTANDMMKEEGIKLNIKVIVTSMFRTVYKYKAMEILKKYNMI